MENHRIGVVGLGLLGRGVAACFLGHGFRVVGYARSEQEHLEARRQIERMVGEMVDVASCGLELTRTWSERFEPAIDYEALADCLLVVESVPEDASTKHAIFEALEKVITPGAILASNTSAIPISLMQKPLRHPERFVGMHWATPAHLTRFLELIRGDQTSDEVLAATAALARRIGKQPSLCQRDVPGFIVNRVAYAMYREVCHLLDTGVADAETIDCALRNTLGLWATMCGPLRWIDLTGGPELYARAMQPVLPTLSNATDVPSGLRGLMEAGARGITNGHGFFEYTTEEARAWEDLYRHHARRATETLNEYFPMAPPSIDDAAGGAGSQDPI